MSGNEKSRGHCPRTHVVSFYVSADAWEMDLALDSFSKIFACVHSLNRNSPDDNQVALDLPEYRMPEKGDKSTVNSNRMIGRHIQVWGSQDALSRLFSDSRLAFLLSVGQVNAASIQEASDTPLYGLRRVRAGEKKTPAGLERARRRRLRRGHADVAVASKSDEKTFSKETGTIRVFSLKGFVVEMKRELLGDRVCVSSYGLMV